MESNKSVSRTLIFAVVILAYPLSVGWQGGLTWETGITTLLIGLAIGALYAMYATGLVVVYTTTGIFNFAQGAIGVISAFLYWQLRTDWDWPTPVALVLVVGVFAPLLGIGLDVLLMRRVQKAPLINQLMITVGLMVFLLALTGMFWSQEQPRRIDPFFGQESFSAGPINITYHRFIVFCSAIIIAIVLRLLFKSRLGVAMRAVVDNRELAALTGARPGMVSSTAWAIGCSLGALAGIMIAPELEMDPLNLNIIIVWGFAAAAFGQLRSLPLALAGALFLGVGKQFLTQFFSWGNEWRFVPDSLAALALVAVVLALPQERLEVGRVASDLKKIQRLTKPWESMIGGIALVVAAIALTGGWLNFGIWDPGAWSEANLNSANAAVATALIGLSLVPLTGWAGQINLAPMAFAGFGAFLYLKLPSGETGDVMWLPVIAALTAPIGALVALPFARLRGLYLALGSMALAHGMAKLFFPHPDILPTSGVVSIPHFDIFNYTLDNRRHLVVAQVAVLALSITALTMLRRTRHARRWIALSNSPAASGMIGMDVMWTKVIVYAFSAAMAGVAGAFYVVARQSADGIRDFELLGGLAIVLLMAVGGMSKPAAALFTMFLPVNRALQQRFAALGNMPELVTIQTRLRQLGVGIASIGMAFRPHGAAVDIGRSFAPLLPWRSDA
ncbi:MAG: ABC transporter permease, partial [Acidobacteria bacterium]|nr:ABC transporter permease [Acidobacteriota bacterium]